MSNHDWLTPTRTSPPSTVYLLALVRSARSQLLVLKPPYVALKSVIHVRTTLLETSLPQFIDIYIYI